MHAAELAAARIDGADPELEAAIATVAGLDAARARRLDEDDPADEGRA